MNREIKFRGWCPHHRRMHFPMQLLDDDCLYWTTDDHDKSDDGFHSYEIMQFTGLLDKNGKEIYEADVVKYTASLVPLVEEVYETVWYQAGFGFKKPGESGCAIYLQTSKLEVMGSVFEHPHLLTNSI